MSTSFKGLFTVAAFTALAAGILLTLIQQVQIIPALTQAETYEHQATPHDHSQGSEGEHAHDEEAWAPADGIERTFFTAIANIVIALGFALLLGALTALRKKGINWRSGLLWGLAGYLVFFVAPSLGLHPELPGTEAANLQLRQLWWILTVICTGAGLALIVFGHKHALRALGAALLVIPHIVGAPQPEVHSALAPEELIRTFILATALANAVFWLALGSLYGYFSQKLAH